MKRRTFLRSGSAAAVTLVITAAADERSTAPQSFLPSEPLTVYPDGTARINALLNASLNVVIPDGIYMITGVLNVRDGHVVSAAAVEKVVLKAPASYGGQIIATYDKSFTLRGLTFDGNYGERLSLEGSTNATLLQIVGGNNVTLENNQFQYAPSFAIWTWRSASMRVRGNTFLECYHPIRMDGSNLQSGDIENNTFHNTDAFKSIQHIEAIGTVNLVLRGNTMRGAGLAEPTLHGYEGTWGNSIYIWRSTGHLVEGNKVYTNYWSALVSGAEASNGIIRNNYFADGVHTPTSVWIEQPGAAYITVDSNEIDGGISCGDSGGDNLTITNNTIRSRSVGIDVNSGAKTVLIQGNQIYSKAGYRFNNGMYLWGKETPDVNVRIFNNLIQGFDKGIAINNWGGVGTVYGVHLSGNTFSNSNVNIWVPSSIVLNQPLGQ
jgi:hypothetical protein